MANSGRWVQRNPRDSCWINPDVSFMQLVYVHKTELHELIIPAKINLPAKCTDFRNTRYRSSLFVDSSASHSAACAVQVVKGVAASDRERDSVHPFYPSAALVSRLFFHQPAQQYKAWNGSNVEIEAGTIETGVPNSHQY